MKQRVNEAVKKTVKKTVKKNVGSTLMQPLNQPLKLSLTALALSLSACNSLPANATAFQGRVIEFKSGPEGFDTKTYFYEGLHEVIAFDAQFTPELARKSISHLRQYTQKPLTWLILTHPNPDKYNGASAFKAEGAKILTSAATAQAIPAVHAYKKYFFVEIAKMFKSGEYPEPVPVDQTFSDQMDLVLRGGEQIKIVELSNPGVSSTQTVIFIKSIQSLFVGDLIHHKAHAWLEGGIVNSEPVPTLMGWKEDLEELKHLFPAQTMVYGGRGESVLLKTAVRSQIEYLTKAEEIIVENIRSLGNQAHGYLGPKAGEHYKNLTAEFQRQFPNYELPYMIEYGAYGLVRQCLAAKIQSQSL